ncbi:MAG: T9SS type A sorting domain-containing protein [Candidatus Cloacimonetes bacterium]|nr:T9SS type A sorting domain-containing protein [Candidatus Cloacimonadota bacterium]
MLIKTYLLVVISCLLVAQLYSFAGGDGSASDPWQIATASHLNEVRNYLGTTHADKHFILINDIDLDISPYNVDPGWEPIGNASNQFTGNFNGCNYRVENLFSNRPDNWYIGLFGYVGSSAQITGLILTGVDVTGYSMVGGVAGFQKGAISSCSISGSITAESRVGGLTGRNEGTIDNCSSSGTITATTGNNAGGLVGRHYAGSITYSFSSCQVLGYGNNSFGGLVGWNESTIDHCHAAGDVDGYLYTGGLVGRNYDGTISYSYATGNVTSTTNCTGGLVGSNGGLPGMDDPIIQYCYATGDVDGDGSVGGLAGENLNLISNSYATGSVHGTNSVAYQKGIGGLVGEQGEDAIVEYSYSVGNVSGNSPTGGLIGYNNRGIVQYGFWNIETSSQSSSAGGVGLTTNQMIQKDSFTNWNFVDTWILEENVTYPYLISIPQNPPPSPFLPAPTGLTVDPITGLFSWNEPDYSGIVLLHYDVYLDGSYVASTGDLFYLYEDLVNGQQYIAGVKAIYDEGESAIISIQFTYQGVGVSNNDLQNFEFLSCFPNPYSHGTTIHFYQKDGSSCTLTIFNQKGQKVRTLLQNEFVQNEFSIFWDGKDDYRNDLENGIYFYKLQYDDNQSFGKMVMIK